jgi:hypothetical protein
VACHRGVGARHRPIDVERTRVARTGASLTFGSTKIAGGAGVSQLKLTPSEEEPYSQYVPPKQQIGIAIGLYQTFFKRPIWAVEYFRGPVQLVQVSEEPGLGRSHHLVRIPAIVNAAIGAS